MYLIRVGDKEAGATGPRIAFKLCLFTCALNFASTHDTIPVKLWPLSDTTRGGEVGHGGPDATLVPGESVYTTDNAPHLGYNALQITETSYVGLSVEDEFQHNFMLMALFHVDLTKSTSFFNYSTPGTTIVFEIYVQACWVHFKSSTDDERKEIKDHCSAGMDWYTVSAGKKDKDMIISVVQAVPSDIKGKKLFTEKYGNAFLDKTIEYPGTVTIGPHQQPTESFAVCCLRIYNENFDVGHIQDQMVEDCEKQPYWDSSVPNPCRTDPCANGGKCAREGETDYSCACGPWFEGKNCTKELWLTERKFNFVGNSDVKGILDPIDNSAGILVRNYRECSTRCLQLNPCQSFTYSLSRECSLYSDVATNPYPSDGSRYYVADSY